MKISCSQESLVKGLNSVKTAVANRATLPILTHILIDARANDGRVRLAATNLDIGINAWIPAQNLEPGAVAVPARLITDFVSTLTDGPVELTLNVSTQTLRVINGRTVANIKGIDANEFPEMSSSGEPKAQVSLDAKPLGEMLDRVVFAAATDESRPVLAGVCAKFDAKQLTLAAADGFRLSVQHTGIEGSSPVEPFSLVIPVKALQEVSRLCSGQLEPVKLIVASDRNQVRFVLSVSEVIAQLIDGAYPDVTRIIPQNHTSRAVVNAGELLTATKMVTAFVDKNGKANGIRLEADATNRRVIVMGAHAERGDGVGDIDAAIEGDTFKVALQAPYLLSMLERVTAPQIAIEFLQNGGQPMPVVVRPVGDEGFVHVMMPLVDTAVPA
ncbi:DNA polymerase III subunit beta [Anaerolineae bacterium]|nr:DNA polymerase III subunit beta [Anaerolineae bacterium]